MQNNNVAFKEISHKSTSWFTVHYFHTSSKSRERRYVQSRLSHRTVSSSIAFFCVLYSDKCDIFSILKQGFVVVLDLHYGKSSRTHHYLFDGFLERWCGVALSHERHNKLFRQFFDEQPPRVCHSLHVIRLQCFECGKCILFDSIKNVIPKSGRPLPCHPLVRMISHHLAYCIHIAFRLVVLEYDL